jgi:hypothetical protein
MGYSERASGANRNSSHTAASGTPTISAGTVAVGDLVVCMGALYGEDLPGGPPAVTSDKTTGTFTLYGSAASTNWVGWIAIGVATSAGTCTVSIPMTGFTVLAASYTVDVFTGQHTTWPPLRTDGGRSTASTNPPSATLTSTIGDLLLGLMYTTTGAPALGPGTSPTFTQIGEDEDNTTYQNHHAEFLISTAGNEAVAWASVSGSTWVIQRVALIPAPTWAQSHYRFRNDDGSETAATWKAAEDGALSAAAGTVRLRTAVKTEFDAPTTQYQLEWLKVGENVWRKVR